MTDCMVLLGELLGELSSKLLILCTYGHIFSFSSFTFTTKMRFNQGLMAISRNDIVAGIVRS